MKKYVLSIVLLLTILITSSVNATNSNEADKVIINAKIYTVDINNPWAEAIAIKGGIITYVGSNEGIKNFIGKTTEVIDLKGAMVLPGFQDAHVHPMEGISLTTFMGCDLLPMMEKSTNPEDWKEAMRKCYEIDYPHDWILGGGHSIQSLIKLKRSPRELLDEIFPDKPALFMEKTSHSMWANSKALEIGGITKDTPNSQGGIIIKDPVTGEPNGILMDSAGDELIHFALKASPALQQARFDAIVASQDYMAKYGITSYTNARVYWDRGNHEPWYKAEKEGVLKSRGVMALWAYPHMDDDYQLKRLKELYKKDEKSLLKWTMVKYYSDGLIENNSAAVIEKYTFIVHPDSKPYGLNYFTEERLVKYVTELEKVGFDAHIHAIGDRGVRETLNALEKVKQNNPELKDKRRHQITHIETIRPSDIPRFEKLNVTADIQYNLEITPDLSDPKALEHFKFDYDHVSIDDPDMYYKMMGDIDIVRSPVLEINETGGRVVLSSDWDVSSIDPLFSIEEVTRRNQGRMPKDELIAFAINAYTKNAAYVMQQDDTTGSIEVGKYADIVVINNNIFTVPVTRIHKAKVLLTLLGGKEVYREKGYKN